MPDLVACDPRQRHFTGELLGVFISPDLIPPPDYRSDLREYGRRAFQRLEIRWDG